MVAQLLRLRLQATLGALRRTPRQMTGLLLGIGLSIAVVWILGLGLFGLRFGDAGNVRDLLVVTGSFVILGFATVPLLFRLEDPMDPRSFALFGMEPRRLAAGLALTGLISVPSIVVAVLSLATVVTWSRGALPVVLAVVCALLAVATCVLASRVVIAVGSVFLSQRRTREFTGMLWLLVIVLVLPAVALLATMDWGNSGLTVYGRAASVVSWTPFGAVWSAPGDAAAGDAGVALLKTAIAAVTVALLWLAWQRLVAKLLVSPVREAPTKSFGGLGWFDALPAGPVGVIAARSLTYWSRDSRYLAPLLIIPVVPFLMIAPLLVAGVPAQPLALLPLPVMCLFLGWSLHNELALDSSAVWLHVSSGVRGWADRLGRTTPILLIGVVLIVGGSAVTAMVFGDWRVFPSVVGISASLLLVGVGLSSIVSARLPYAAVLPGDSPFQQPQTSGGSAVLSQSISLFGTLLLSLPTVWFAARALVESPSWHVVALLCGLGTGLIVLVLGVLVGGRVFDRRGPEIVGFATSV
jgi:ABC-2 type transport system permease protein